MFYIWVYQALTHFFKDNFKKKLKQFLLKIFKAIKIDSHFFSSPTKNL